MTEELIEYRLLHTPLLRVWLWRLDESRWTVKGWREGEGEMRIHGRMMGRFGPPWRYCLRIRCGHWSLHIGWGRYRSLYPHEQRGP